MRWTAKRFWRERGDVEVGLPFMGTANDLLRAAFLARAEEAEVLGAHPEPGYATLRVSGLSRHWREMLQISLNKKAPIGTTYRVVLLDPKERNKWQRLLLHFRRLR